WSFRTTSAEGVDARRQPSRNGAFAAFSRPFNGAVAIARSIVHDPPALVLDEPTLRPGSAAVRGPTPVAESRERGRSVVFSPETMSQVGLRARSRRNHRWAAAHCGRYDLRISPLACAGARYRCAFLKIVGVLLETSERCVGSSRRS